MLFNLTEHKLVPKHEILKENDVKELFEKYKINAKKLPRILQTDPMAMALNANIGDIIKIERASSTAGSAVYYRLVVRG